MINKLRVARNLAGLRQSDVAERVGISRPLLSLFEVGNARPSAEIEYKLSEVLGLPVDVLFPDRTEGEEE